MAEADAANESDNRSSEALEKGVSIHELLYGVESFYAIVQPGRN
jgi:hypothetical protein